MQHENKENGGQLRKHLGSIILSVYLLHATQRGRKQRRGGEGKRKKGEKERGKGGEEKTSYISPQAMYILAWLTSVNQLIPVIVDQKRAKEVAPLIGHRPIGGLCGSVMPPQGTPCRAMPDRNGLKARSAWSSKNNQTMKGPEQQNNIGNIGFEAILVFPK